MRNMVGLSWPLVKGAGATGPGSGSARHALLTKVTRSARVFHHKQCGASCATELRSKGCARGRSVSGRRMVRSGCRRSPGDPLPRRRHAGRGRVRRDAVRQRGRDRRGPPGIRRRPLAAHLRAGARRAAAAHRRSDRARRQGVRPRRIAGHRQAAGGERVRHRRCGLLFPLLRRDRGYQRRPGDRHRARRRRQPRHLRAGRCLWVDHSVELPAAPGVVEGRPRASGRKHDRSQAE